MFTETAQYYDKIYSFKDYPAEIDRLMAIFREHQPSAGTYLLDVACGTGLHLKSLKERYDVEGLNISLELLTIARQRLPGIPLHHGDMMAFDLDLHYLVGTPAGTEHLVEHHAMALFTTEDMHAAMAPAGLEVTSDPQGLMGRGLFIGRHLG